MIGQSHDQVTDSGWSLTREGVTRPAPPIFCLCHKHSSEPQAVPGVKS